MKTFLPPGVILRITLKLILIFSFSAASYSQSFFGMSSSPTDNTAGNGPTATVVPPGSMLAGDLVIVYGQCRNTSATLSIAAGTGQTWNSGTMYQPGGGNQTIFISWCRFNGTWGGGGNVSVSGGTAGTALTAVMYVYRPSVATNTWGVNNVQSDANGTGTAQTITGTTTTFGKTVTMAFWSNAAQNTWGPTGAAPINTGWTFPIATSQIRNTQGTGQSHTAAYNIQAVPATLNNTRQTQSVSTTTLRSIMTWYELNDEYAAPVTLTPAGSCTNITGTMAGATISASIPAFTCATSSFLFDVWYSFTATSSNHTIRLDNYGAAYTRRQFAVYQVNTLGTLSAVTCSALSTSGTTALSVNFTDYSPGTTYLVRVMYPNTVNTGLSAATSTFTLCVTNGTNNVVQPVLSGKSYTNITRPNGGTVQTGDVLEFRQSINPGNWSVTDGSMYNVTYHDTIPAGLSYIANSIAFQTNEGLQFESGITGSVNLTDASGDDEAVYSGGIMRVNVGSLPRQGASALAARQLVYQGSPAVTPITYSPAGGGKIHARGRPSQFAQYVVIVVRYRVTVTAATGTTITTSNGQFRYNPTTTDIASPQTLIDFPRYSIYVSATNTSTLCQGGSGVNVYTGGTFGSGNKRHDSTQMAVVPGYVWKPFAASAPQDGEFAVVNNTSADGSINKYSAFPGATRVHNVWDIIGDHTGATNVDSGNVAVPWGTTGGYMAVVNAAFGINTALQKTITGMCPDTYYEFSAWFKNICAGCSTDSAGRAMGDGALFKPYLTTKTLNDSAGVSPDLTYTIDGVDYYTTGPIIYDKKWVKKGFLFKSGASGNATLTIRNNAAGGGGNDWAIDDITLNTCFPSMTYSPSAAPNVCAGNTIKITDTVRSVFNNYVEYKWQRSTTGAGGPWVDIVGTTGTGSPVWNPVLNVYEYVSSYNIPTSQTTVANNHDLYRLIVASTSGNLAGTSCSYTDPTTIINLTVLPACGPPLKADLLSATGRVTDNVSKIFWITADEDEQVSFNVEKSIDGINFTSIGTVNGYFNISSPKNYYNFTDPVLITAKTYYRVVMTNSLNTKKYSSLIVLNPAVSNKFGFGNVTNPFASNLQYEINSEAIGNARIELIDGYGKIVKSEIQRIYPGSNSLNMYTVDNLPDGVYVIRATMNGNTIYHKVIKGK